ncbi:MAG: class I SAM-dependent methyltransferase [Bradymonadales bacterium]|nr:MAG: class I SAM-dependent methyltransferase [Bradymonadales bacterium]
MESLRNSSVSWEADIYSKGKQLNHWPHSDLVSTVMRLSSGKDRSKLKILEVGCGAGNNIWFLAKEGFRAFGSDFSESAIEYAKNRLAKESLAAELSVSDLVKLDFPSEHFDMIIDRGALTQNSYDSIAKAVSEIHRCLKPDGQFIAFTLYGDLHPGKKFGKEVSSKCFDHFTDGYFKTVGLTSFFTAQDLRQLTSSFNEVTITKMQSRDEHDQILSEAYQLIAIK